ncbi:MAG: class I SAM-dependent methyltransferase [Acidimicrobiales bacterium]
MTGPSWPARHADEVGEALAGGRPSSIKRLYVNLGEFLEEDYGNDVAGAPLLSLPETLPVVLRLLEGVDGLLLGAGCGPNPAVAIAIAREPGRSVVALDIGTGMVRLAVARARREGVHLLGVVGDVEALPFCEGAFAGGVCDDTIEHLPDDDQGARELGRVLGPGVGWWWPRRIAAASPSSVTSCGIECEADAGRPRTTSSWRATSGSTRGGSWPASSSRTSGCAVAPRWAGPVAGTGGW